MRQSIANAEKIYQGLKEAEINFIVHLPESYMKELIPFIRKDPSIKYVQVCREEVGVNIAAGALLGGKRPAILMEDTGLGNSINPLVSIHSLWRIPLLMLMSYRGDVGDFTFYTAPCRYAEPVLKALGIGSYVLRDPEQIIPMIRDCSRTTFAQKMPVALLVAKQVIWEE
jgi:sulfopyruvate decarboxylase subunit alpha